MSDEAALPFVAGRIVIADWRGGALPKEPNKLRPAVIVGDESLYDDDYENLLVVPLTEDERLAIALLSVRIEPPATNGCAKVCWAMAHMVSAVSRLRVRPTPSVVTNDQLAEIRRLIALAVGA